MTSLMDLADPAPEPGTADWNDEGVLYLPEFLDPLLITAYQDEWIEANGWRGVTQAYKLGEDGGHWDSTASAANPEELFVINADRPGGWPDACPYMRHDALRAICTTQELAHVLDTLTGEPMGVHLNLTGWQSTQRNWHQDGYLNPAGVGDYYAAVWMALGDVHPDSGVFEYVPGSHRWHRLTHEKIATVVDTSDPLWPQYTEAILTDLVDDEITARDAEVKRYAPRRGDVLVWHPRLYHRGTAPVVEHAYRPALIAHFSGILHRPDMPPPTRSEGGGWYFPIITEQPVA
jgi:ectoine hydroxylase-related dioxygenase (phytanoyl-CoA dioxygenase family)